MTPDPDPALAQWLAAEVGLPPHHPNVRLLAARWPALVQALALVLASPEGHGVVTVRVVETNGEQSLVIESAPTRRH